MNDWLAYYESPIGRIELCGTGDAVTSVRFLDEEMGRTPAPDTAVLPPDHVSTACIQQLDEYFRGERKAFAIPLAFSGTPFQQGVWQAIADIPFGQTITYRSLAASIGNDRAIRAAGTATGKNRFALFIPCHRVIGSDESLHGYAWGLWRKEWLLEHEKKMAFD
ncbi:methylated-DNA--[protein]-cysteine S-methyltransferase [Brevibacillus migulae]|uniref:methylated-DNA--[protein]-cysteine S-methyltransferase n=1 Tax=Brevibacillus migulae TaxID=1644114 RepID=UPI00106E757B|nr:methylated-DNA--[protein]-cysteine S-methyltransferase [Brevibacillus migulae]